MTKSNSPTRHAIFVTEAFYSKQKLYGVSGHVQLPLKAACLLAERIGNVDLITTRPPGADQLMLELPASVKVQLVTHATRPWPETGVNPAAAAVQIGQLLALVSRKRYRVIHFFGGPKTGLVAALVKTFYPRMAVLYSPLSAPAAPGSVQSKALRVAFGRLDRVVALTEFVSKQWAAVVGHDRTAIIRPGVLKPMFPPKEAVARDSVLFWRNADRENGADLMIEAARELAPRHPTLRFVFALRSGSEFEDRATGLAGQYPNVVTYIQPYPDGLLIENLLDRALLVVAPFRQLSMNPQMAILESLYAGVPVIASAIESNPELVREGSTGVILDRLDTRSIVRAVERLLADRELLACMAQNANPVTSVAFNWVDFGNDLLAIHRAALQGA